MHIDINISDAARVFIGNGQGGVNWGGTVSIPSKLADLLRVTPQIGLIKRSLSSGHLDWKRYGEPSLQLIYEKGPIEFTIGPQQWNTSSSACSVESWDNGCANDFFDVLIFGDTFLLVSFHSHINRHPCVARVP
jgi:hypothetical protein